MQGVVSYWGIVGLLLAQAALSIYLQGVVNMVTTYAEHMKANPDVTITGGRDLDHDMEYEDRSGWEICNRCGGQENEIDEVCPDSDYAVDFASDWEEYEEVPFDGIDGPGCPRYRLEED